MPRLTWTALVPREEGQNMTDAAWDVEGTLALGVNHVVGRYRYDLATERWWWSDETYRIHGFEPGDVVPTTALILAHKHPDDRDRVSQVLQQACRTGDPFSSVHRIMDARGQERTLAVVGEGRRDEGSGDVCELVGYFTDVTGSVARIADARATASIRASAENRAAIEQAKAIVVCAFGMNVEGAFEWLRVASNRSNTPLRELSRQIVDLATRSNGDIHRIASALGDMPRRRRGSAATPNPRRG
jgi:hypothetical protein